MTIKELYKNMVELEKVADEAEKAWDSDCENEELENAFDKAYEAAFNATEMLVNELCKFGYDKKIWHKVLLTKREQVEKIISQAA